MILAVDPGNLESGYCVFNELDETFTDFGKVGNEKICDIIDKYRPICQHFVLENMANFGGSSPGRDVLDTCIWIGIFSERWGRAKTEFVFRKTVVTHHTNNPKGGDSDIRRALIERYGDPTRGKKKQKGNKMQDVVKDVLSALAIAVYVSDMLCNRVFAGKSQFQQFLVVKPESTQE